MQVDNARVREMIDGYRLSQAIFVAAELGIADRLGLKAAHFQALAAATETDPPSLLRLLRALASAGLLEDAGEGEFALTAPGRLLQQGAEGSLHAWARLSASLYHPWGDLLRTIRTGKQAFDSAYGKNRWQHLSDSAADSRAFNEAMAESSARVARALLACLDLSGFQTIVDIGGGEGVLIEAILKAYPRLRGILFDLPEALRDARPRIEEAGLAGRCELAEGSFLDGVPRGGDAYLLSRVLHDWNDEHGVVILRRLRGAMLHGARLFLVERVLDPHRPAPEATLSDLSMMVMNGGRERTRAEFEQLLTSAQFKLARIIPMLPPFQVIEAEPT